MLRSCSAHEAYIRSYRGRVRSARAIEFLLLDSIFPRSAVHCLGEIDEVTIDCVQVVANAVGTAVGGITGPLLFGQLIESSDRGLAAIDRDAARPQAMRQLVKQDVVEERVEAQKVAQRRPFPQHLPALVAAAINTVVAEKVADVLGIAPRAAAQVLDEER